MGLGMLRVLLWSSLIANSLTESGKKLSYACICVEITSDSPFLNSIDIEYLMVEGLWSLLSTLGGHLYAFFVMFFVIRIKCVVIRLVASMLPRDGIMLYKDGITSDGVLGSM